MYRGFNLKIGELKNEFYEPGLRLHEEYKTPVQDALKNFISENGVIDGAKLREHWFPQVKTDVFISHAHKDARNAIRLAGWLWETFEVKAFIDSCIWGYADHLLKRIDNEYCLNEGGHTYNYESRNLSTAHVHMMLSTALQMMIDKTECLIFMNTPEAISSSDAIKAKTTSAWIYAEIVMAQLTRQTSKGSHREALTKTFSKGRKLNEALEIEYISLSGLTNLSVKHLTAWQQNWNSYFPKEEYPLDLLYDLLDSANAL